MDSYGILLAVIGAVASIDSASANSLDPCNSIEGTASDIRLTLQSAVLDKNGAFVGKFKIENQSKTKPFSVGLVRQGKVDFAFPPDASIEYMDMSSDWRRLLNLPGSFRGVMSMRVLSPGKSYSFNATLITPEAASLNAREFRFLLRTYSPRLCVFSNSFRGLPLRPRVDRLQPVNP